MKILYLDCSMGAAGDMLTAALLELLPDPDAFLLRLNALGIPGVRFEKENAIKCGISGTHMHVYVDGEEEGADDAADASAHGHGHIHRHLSDIEAIVNGLPVPEAVKEDVIAVEDTIDVFTYLANYDPQTRQVFSQNQTAYAIIDSCQNKSCAMPKNLPESLKTAAPTEPSTRLAVQRVVLSLPSLVKEDSRRLRRESSAVA